MELFYIIFHTLISISLISCGYPLSAIKNKNIYNSENFLQQLIFNLVIQINIILFLALTNLTLDTIVIIYFLYILLMIMPMYKRIHWFSSNKILYFVIFFILFILSIDISLNLTLGWDSQKFWFYKALNFYDEGTIKELTNQPLGDGYSYPFLGSLLWAFFWKISFISEEYSGRLFYALLYILALFSLSDKLKTSLIPKIIFSLFLLLISYNYNLFGGEQDILIFSFVSFLAFFIHEIFINKIKNLKPLNLLIIPLIFNCLIWIKHEGTIYSLIVLFILIFFSHIKLKQKAILFLSTIFLIFIKIFVFYFFSLDITINSCCWNDVSLSSILSNITFDRILVIIEYFIYSFLKNYFFIVSAIILIISLLYKIKIKKVKYIYFFYFLSFGFIITAYMSMDKSVDIGYMLKVGLDRLLYGVSPFFILIAIEYFNSQKRIKL